MRRSMLLRRSAWVALLACVVCTQAATAQESTAAQASAAAQPSADGWPAGLDVSQLQTVYVTSTSGRETTGKLLRIDRDVLVLLAEGSEETFPIASVRRIQKRDSLRNGVLIGAVVGGVLGVLSGGLADCPGDDPGRRCAGVRVALVGVSTGVYAALGAAIDALIPGRTTMYAAPAGETTRAIGRLSPSLNRVQAHMSIRW